MKKINNKGFSLIEILVSLAIAGIVAVALSTLLNSSANSFNTSSDDIETQQEAEITSNFIYELLLEATDVKVMTVNSSGKSLYTVVICNNKYEKIAEGNHQAVPMHNFICYDADEQKMYYTNCVDGGDEINSTYVSTCVSGICKNTKLLAENVTSFSMTPSSLKAGEPMKYYITVAKQNARFKCSNTVETRNNITDETEIITS